MLETARPFGFPGGTRVTLRIAQEDGAIGQGVGRFRLAATSAADPLIGATVPAALRPLALRDPTDRPEDGAKELATHFRQTTPSLKATATSCRRLARR